MVEKKKDIYTYGNYSKSIIQLKKQHLKTAVCFINVYGALLYIPDNKGFFFCPCGACMCSMCWCFKVIIKIQESKRKNIPGQTILINDIFSDITVNNQYNKAQFYPQYIFRIIARIFFIVLN